MEGRDKACMKACEAAHVRAHPALGAALQEGTGRAEKDPQRTIEAHGGGSLLGKTLR